MIPKLLIHRLDFDSKALHCVIWKDKGILILHLQLSTSARQILQDSQTYLFKIVINVIILTFIEYLLSANTVLNADM